MPASDYFTVTGGGSYINYNEQPEYIYFQLLGTVGSAISFKQNLTTYFTVIGGGAGGGGGGHDNGAGSPEYPSAGGGGAGACGKISLITDNNVPYPYIVGTKGNHGEGNLSGSSGTISSVTFSGTQNISAGGGEYGKGHYEDNIGGIGGTLIINNLTTIISGVSGNGGNGVKVTNINNPPFDEGTPGIDQIPISIEIYPGFSIRVGGGGGGADATSGGAPPNPPYQGGRGGDGIGGAIGSGTVTIKPGITTISDGEKGQTYGAGGGGGGQPGGDGIDGSRRSTLSPYYYISWGGMGGDGAIFVYIDLPPPVPPPPISNRPGPIQICDSRFAKCNLTTKTNFSSGNVTIQGTTRPLKLSYLTRTVVPARNHKLVYANKPNNEYGQRAGGPVGYGQPPKNNFI